MDLPPKLKSYNLYRLLEIDDFSEPLEIKQGFRKLVLKYHPDRSPDHKDSKSKLHLGLQAYGVLRDEERRQKYNALLRSRSASRSHFNSRELLQQRKNSAHRHYVQRYEIDPAFNRFVEECRQNYRVFLDNMGDIKPRPKVYNKKSQGSPVHDEFVDECRKDFQKFLQTIPRVRS